MALVTGAQATETVEPTNRSFDDPAPAAVQNAVGSDQWRSVGGCPGKDRRQLADRDHWGIEDGDRSDQGAQRGGRHDRGGSEGPEAERVRIFLHPVRQGT